MGPLRVLVAAMAASAPEGRRQMGGGDTGCSPPLGAKWDRWDMAGSTYAYCYAGCHMPWFVRNSERYNLGAYAGLVGVDHYWTGQGVPCHDGAPHEFDMQDNLAREWKQYFPGLRFLSYRIPSAVPYDKVVRDKIVADPDHFVRWKVAPDSATRAAQQCPAPGEPGECTAGSVCYNNISPCFNDVHRINAANHSCSFKIQAASYNWANADAGKWYIDNVILRSLDAADGVWLDGNGYDNGAWMCAGTSGGFDGTNSPQSSQEIVAWLAAEAAVASAARQQLIAKGGFDGLGCMDFRVESLPQARDDPATCGQKLMATAAWGANHSNYNAVVAYGYDTGAGGYNDSTAAAAVAAFMIMRGQHWFFGISEHNPCNPKHYPVTGRCHSDGCGKPCPVDSNTVDPNTAKLLVTDYGRPLAGAEAVPGKSGVFQRRYEQATVLLDCNDFSGRFQLE